MRRSLFGALMALFLPAVAAAEPAADFYRGKTVRLVVAYPAGGAYGVYSRLAADHLGRFIPGGPNVVVEHMPGAGGLVGANYVYNLAPQDGSYIAMLSKDVALSALFTPEAVKYDPRRLNFIGTLLPYSAVFIVWHTAGIRTWQDAQKKEVVVAATNKNAHEYTEMALLREFAGLKLRAVTGYRGAGAMYLAMEQGEVHGRIGGWVGLKSVKADYLAQKKVDVILQTGLAREPDLPHVPTMVEIAGTPEAKKLFGLLAMGTPVGWGLSAPPNVLPARVAALRAAFESMVRDRAFLEAASKQRAEITPIAGEKVQEAIAETMAADPAIVARIKRAAAM